MQPWKKPSSDTSRAVPYSSDSHDTYLTSAHSDKRVASEPTRSAAGRDSTVRNAPAVSCLARPLISRRGRRHKPCSYKIG